MRIIIRLKNPKYCEDCPMLDFGRVCKELNLNPETSFDNVEKLGYGLHLIRPEECIKKHGE